MNIGVAVYTPEQVAYMDEVAKFCSQYIYALKSANPLDEFFPAEEVTNGSSVEISIIGYAEAQTFDPTGANIWKQHAPKIETIYNPDGWDLKQFIQTLRPDDIRKAMNTNVSPEETAAKIIDSCTQGNDNYRYKQIREVMTTAGFFKDYATICGYKPKNMTGVLALCKDAFAHLAADNADSTASTTIEMKTPEEDIYTLIPTKVLNLLDTTELANAYNLEKAKLIGKIVPINVDDLDKKYWYKIRVCDRKILRRYRRIYDTLEDRNNTGRFVQEILATEELTFLCGLFKGVEIDATEACTAKLAEICTAKAG